ncbi:MAG: toxin-antitoxin system HicB family antitoxin [Chloroflexi bacterium]|nr:toxin-antitoxin system HicB family antitoxin [Chloroflexota bacterium]MDA1146605.1 toxin-antitoxin system HicB family antitoxin [Chloroflexota bacterium]
MANDTERRSQAAELAALPYAFVLVHDADGGAWTVTVLEFPGVISEGDAPHEALANGREALEQMIDFLLEQGRPIPEPFQTREFSGRTELRLNPETHRRAVMLAANEGVSLNRWLSAAVAAYGGLGPPPPQPPPAAAAKLRLVAEDPGSYEDDRPRR